MPEMGIFLSIHTHEMHFILPHFEHNLPILGKLCSFLRIFSPFLVKIVDFQGIYRKY